MNEHYEFRLRPLPYAYNELEPYIDTETVMLHHNKHLQAYIDNLNEAIAPYPQYYDWGLEKLIMNAPRMPSTIRVKVKNNAGGVYNHNLYFDCMYKGMQNMPYGKVNDALIRYFQSYENFKRLFKECAMSVFGSGYAWLIADKNDKLMIMPTANQDTPNLYTHKPILIIDIWEHSYYLKYKNQRSSYIDNWFNIINWEQVESNFTKSNY